MEVCSVSGSLKDSDDGVHLVVDLRPATVTTTKKNNKLINNKPGCATEDTHNPGEEANNRWLTCKSF
jgi:hypothetical protein